MFRHLSSKPIIPPLGSFTTATHLNPCPVSISHISNMTARVGAKRDAAHLSDSTLGSKKPKPDGSITSFFGVPKAKSISNNTASGRGASTVSPKFNKAKWVSGLTGEQRELLDLEIETLDESWLAQLKEELLTNEFLNLKRFLKKEIASGAKIFPPLEDVYSWSRHTPLHKVKVVILGQDPYHNVGQAHGLCFSVKPPTRAPPSLANIYIALKNDYPSFQPPPNKGGLLTPWAERGVLMLNTCLTVRAHNANSHSKRGWERFTQKVIDVVARSRTHGVVFLAWGTPAGQRVANIQKDRHCVLRSVHPSPLSARNGFFTCGHFKKANDWLQQRYGDDGIIDWSLIPSLQDRAVTSTSTIVKADTVVRETESIMRAEGGAVKVDVSIKGARIESNDYDTDDDIAALEALAAVEALESKE